MYARLASIAGRRAVTASLPSASAAAAVRMVLARPLSVRTMVASATPAAPAPPAAAAPRDEREVHMVMVGPGIERAVIGHVGETLLQVCQMNDVDQIEGACEGCMCCSTCHLIFEPSTFKALGPVSDDEQDLIDRAAGATDTSRLGCQVRVSKQLEGARIRIPSEFTNQMR